ncbi:MAG: GTP-binding protein EngA [Candidatus Kapaibacterium sp.]|jgi:GTP-binding protein|nr:MAG: GTP-binding protein EngA [Candidatus Kapabacteria bacterium]ROL56532.1 MAG: ribosome biogenesis GTPase Der [Bacteroidetes/Chlorobi group bacterium Naka2016]
MSLVAIVGRPNVGKSTLFNRLIGQKNAIVDDLPGVTRDRIYGQSEWNGKKFYVIDTGGFVPKSEDLIEQAIKEQAMIAIDESDVVLFVCDGRDGVTSYDIEIANILRQSKKNVLLLVNKCDNPQQDLNSYEFYSLGLGNPYPISALSGRNTWEFLDELVELLPPKEIEEKDTNLKIAIVGRPNVGKSSIVNAIVGKERSIVTDIPGTTRDSIDTVIKYYNEEITLIDTAGLRKRSNIKESIEFYSTVRTIRAIERCDVAVIVLDATRGLEDQDKKIINQVDEARKGMILAVNKWDLIENKETKTADEFKKTIYEKLQTYYYVPILFVSAVTKQRLVKILEKAKEIKSNRMTRIPTAQLNRDILPELEKVPPPSVKGKDLRINYITQTRTEPPVFVFFSNFPDLIPDSYKRFIEKIFREKYNFEGTPISFVFRKKHKNEDF